LSDNPIVVEYDPNWPRQFEALAAVLAEAMGDLALRIHHVGSTSIPGMAAKPVLDIDIELAPGVTVAAATAALEPLGYQYHGEQGIPERHVYKCDSPTGPSSQECASWPTHHLYVCPHGSVELARHLLFRDKLRNSNTLRREYLQLKQECLRRANGERQVYVDEKERLGTAFFNQVLSPSQ
jgi:GrpB-like predicted nucleotidyltransferase (UPF0157 family)